MNGATRLDRIMPRLTFDDRLDGLLAAYHADRRADPSLLRTMPESDFGRWNRVADILDALHGGLGHYLQLLESFVTQAELRLALAEQSVQLGRGFKHRQAEMEEAVDRLYRSVAEEVVLRWQEVRLAELAVAHFNEELGGRTLLHHDATATLNDCRERLLALRERLATADLRADIPCQLSEPPAADLERMLELLRLPRMLV